MTEPDRSVHFDETARLIDSDLGHLGNCDLLRGSINDMHPSAVQHQFFQHLSSSVSSTASSSVVPLLKVYRRRWYILFIFTTFSFVQVETISRNSFKYHKIILRQFLVLR